MVHARSLTKSFLVLSWFLSWCVCLWFRVAKGHNVTFMVEQQGRANYLLPYLDGPLLSLVALSLFGLKAGSSRI